MGLMYMGLSAGGMIFAPLIGRINLTFGWRYAYLFLAVFVLVVALPFSLLVIREKPPGEGQTGSAPKKPAGPAEIPESLGHGPGPVNPGKPLRKIVSTRSFRWITLTFFLGAMAMMATLQHQVAIMAEKGISYLAASTALGVTSGMGAVGKFCFGRMTETLPLKWVVTACYSLQAAAVLLMLDLSCPDLIWVYALVFGFGMGGVLVLQPLAVGQYFGLGSFSMVLGIISFGQSLGASLGAFGAGLIYDSFGSYQPAMQTFLIIYAATVFSIFMAGEPHG